MYFLNLFHEKASLPRKEVTWRKVTPNPILVPITSESQDSSTKFPTPTLLDSSNPSLIPNMPSIQTQRAKRSINNMKKIVDKLNALEHEDIVQLLNA